MPLHFGNTKGGCQAAIVYTSLVTMRNWQFSFIPTAIYREAEDAA